MDKKITRRVVLGTLVAGLAAGPFLMSRLRRKNTEDIIRELQYAPFDVTNKGYFADVPLEKVKEAFDDMFKERDAWLKFRKFSGNVVVTLGDSGERVECHLTFQLLPSQKMAAGRYPGFPWVYHFTCSDLVSKKQLWVYTLGRNDNSSHFEGEKKKTEVIDYQAGAFTFPLEAMYGFSNELVEEAFRTSYKVSVNPDFCEIPRSYCFRPLESGTDMGQFLTKEGRMSTLRTSRLTGDSGKGAQWEGFDWKSFGKLHFPSRVELSELTYGEGDSFERKLLAAYVFEKFTVS